MAPAQPTELSTHPSIMDFLSDHKLGKIKERLTESPVCLTSCDWSITSQSSIILLFHLVGTEQN